MRAPRRRPDTLPILQLLPNLVTILGLSAGLTAIRFVFDGRYDVAAALILFAAVIDGLDGLMARRLNAASAFGAELDSLSDFLCFGVAPGILVYHSALAGLGGPGWVFVLVFAICACLRLARFNVTRGAVVPGDRAHFVGVPAPAGAVLAMLPVYLALAGVAAPAAAPLLVAPWLGVVGLLMVSRLRTPSPKGLRIRRDKAGWVLVGGAAVAGLGFARFWLVMVLVVAGYAAVLVHAAAAALRRGQGDAA